MCTRRFNGNLEYQIGLNQLSILEKGEKIIFKFEGSLEDRSGPCVRTIHRLHQENTTFFMKTLKGDYRYVPSKGHPGDLGEYPLLGTDKNEQLRPHEIEEIVVTGFNY